jgi:hypothetical protein
MLPEWEHLSKRWMKQYHGEHFMERMEDVERFSGIETLKESHGKTEGLLNDFVKGVESAGQVG